MLATAIIVFREVLEAALIVGIVMAACRGVAWRNFWVGWGAAGGIAGAAIVALFAGAIASAAAGMGQELFNASILFLAVLMLGWHSVWMSRHGRELAQQVSGVSRAVIAGTRPLYALAVVTGVAVLREGSETVLFLYGIAASEEGGALALVAGGCLGVLAGVGVGFGLYHGLLRIPMKHLFTVTNWLVLLLAAGMASQGAGFLVQADLLPPLGEAIWDTSAVLTEGSVVGKALHTLIGYVSRPAGIQVLFYLATLLIIGVLMQVVGKGASSAAPKSRTVRLMATGIVIVGLGASGLAPDARADFQVRSPFVTLGEIEIEHNGSITFDRNDERNNERSFTYSLGYGVTSFWKTELEGEWERAAGPDGQTRFSAFTWENTFQILPQGQYPVDLGFFVEYSRARFRDDGADTITFGPLVQFTTGPLVHTANVLFDRDVGGGGREPGVRLDYAWQTRYPWLHWLDLGVEFYGELGQIGNFPRLAEQQHRGGPVLLGTVKLRDLGLGNIGAIKYEVGYLFGFTRETSSGALRWKLEYEFHF